MPLTGIPEEGQRTAHGHIAAEYIVDGRPFGVLILVLLQSQVCALLYIKAAAKGERVLMLVPTATTLHLDDDLTGIGDIDLILTSGRSSRTLAEDGHFFRNGFFIWRCR